MTSEQTIKTAKRLLKPEFHDQLKVSVRRGIGDDGFEFSFRCVEYNGGKNYIGEEVLEINCVD